jgi:hypothetical protein
LSQGDIAIGEGEAGFEGFVGVRAGMVVRVEDVYGLGELFEFADGGFGGAAQALAGGNVEEVGDRFSLEGGIGYIEAGSFDDTVVEGNAEIGAVGADLEDFATGGVADGEAIA